MGRAGQITLETERLVLEPVSPAHADGIYRAVMDSRPELLPWMPWAREPKLDVNVDMSRDDRLLHFAVIERESGTELGVAGHNREGSDMA